MASTQRNTARGVIHTIHMGGTVGAVPCGTVRGKPRTRTSGHTCAGDDCVAWIPATAMYCECCKTANALDYRTRDNLKAFDLHVEAMYEGAKQAYRARQKAKRLARQ